MKITCPNSQTSLNIPDKLMGKKFRCPACGEIHAAPGGEAPAEPAGPRPRSSLGIEGTSAEPSPAAKAPLPRPRTGGTDTAQRSAERGEKRERRERRKPAPGMSGKTKALIGGCVGVALLIGVVGYLIHESSETSRILGLVTTAFSNADEAREKGDFKKAAAFAKQAAEVLRRHPDRFEAKAKTEHLLRVTDIESSADIFAQIESIEKGRGEIGGKVGQLNATLDTKLVKADKMLAKVIRKKMVALILGQAELIAKKKDEPQAIVRSLEDFREAYAKYLPKDAAAKLDRAVTKSLDEARRTIREQTEKVLADIPEMLSKGEVPAAFAMPAKHLRTLQDLPKTLAEDTLKEYEKVISTLRTGESPDTTLKISTKGSAALKQIFKLTALINEARTKSASGVVDTSGFEKEIQSLQAKAKELFDPSQRAVDYAVAEIGKATSQLGKMKRLREDFVRRKKAGDPNGRFGELVFLAALAAPDVRLLTDSIVDTRTKFAATLVMDEVPVEFVFDRSVQGRYLTFNSGGYVFRLPIRWPLALFSGYLWSAGLSRDMNKAGIKPDRFAYWSVTEGPGYPVAIGKDKDGDTYCFLKGELSKATDVKDENGTLVDNYKTVARSLHMGIKNDATIDDKLRRALDPILNATYGKIDPQDHIDGDFARYAVSTNYLTRNIPDLAEKHKEVLTRFRMALKEVGIPRVQFVLPMKDGTTVAAMKELASDLKQTRSEGGDQSLSVGARTAYSWRVIDTTEKVTIFAVPLPERSWYSLYLATTYAGEHEKRPEGAKPIRLEVYHSAAGLLASYKPGDEKISGDPEKWNKALGTDLAGFTVAKYGKPGWGFPIHIPLIGAKGNTIGIATRQGVINSPDFSKYRDDEKRKEVQNSWLTKCAEILKTPGELELFFNHMARYSFDSPITSKPGLIGSRSNSGDDHQTVYQFLDRKIAGRFVGDCDDLAEFFQVVTRRQGKLSHVLSLPGHAACGFVDMDAPEPLAEGKFDFIILHTGPALIFSEKTLHKAVENAYRSFDKDGDMRFSNAQVPFLFRFANESTRRPYVLSDLIFADPEYSEAMVRVQGYWLYHYYSTAIKTMEDMIKIDTSVGTVGELASLYSQVSFFREAEEMREKQAASAADQGEMVKLQVLQGKMQLHAKSENKEKLMAIIAELEKVMLGYIQKNDGRSYQRSIGIRLGMAYTVIGEKEPIHALRILNLDFNFARRRGILPEYLLRVAVAVYGAIAEKKELGKKLTLQENNILTNFGTMIERGFTQRFFKQDHSFGQNLGCYSLIGSYAVAKMGRKEGIKKLIAEGPYPDPAAKRDHVRRPAQVTEEDWAWARVSPHLYLGLVAQMIDKKEKEFYDPQGALPLIEAMERATKHAEKSGLGIYSVTKGAILKMKLIRALITQNVDQFNQVLTEIRETKYSRFVDNAADLFGEYSELLPPKKFEAWMKVFHEHVPGHQYYFQIAYRALDERHYDHSLIAARAAARFFPKIPGMQKEAKYMEELIKEVRGRDKSEKAGKKQSALDLLKPAA